MKGPMLICFFFERINTEENPFLFVSTPALLLFRTCVVSYLRCFVLSQFRSFVVSYFRLLFCTFFFSQPDTFLVSYFGCFIEMDGGASLQTKSKRQRNNGSTKQQKYETTKV